MKPSALPYRLCSTKPKGHRLEAGGRVQQKPQLPFLKLPMCTIHLQRSSYRMGPIVCTVQGECPEELEPEVPGTDIDVNLVRKEEDYSEPEKPK